MLLPTTLVGSYPQPVWLIDPQGKLSKQVPRVRAQDFSADSDPRIGPRAAQDDATLLAIRDQERAGLDIITDGEQRRESYSNRFATALAGIDLENRAKPPIEPGGFQPCRGWWDRLGASIRSRCATWSSCAPIRSA